MEVQLFHDRLTDSLILTELTAVGLLTINAAVPVKSKTVCHTPDHAAPGRRLPPVQTRELNFDLLFVLYDYQFQPL